MMVRGQGARTERKPRQGAKAEPKGNKAEPEKPIEVTAKTAIEAETLKGDLRDQFLNFIKYKHPTFWDKLTEGQQKAFIDESALIAGTCVHRSLIIIKS